ncbi:Trm112 family protein [Streptomyces oceani]|uniref:Uncharacterized protein n=1 Tax=Streptomyces oceani TaxID=1075402 RepID=A0A1E7KNK6_9ACTN|nr:Trm112 family protein [Streptomyces oceani]OEV05476.1 hypothetical protein AN216_03185 [Streptomyces oceani]
MPLEAGLLEILACPACHATLREERRSAGPDGAGAPGSASPGTDTPGSDSEAPEAELVCTASTGCGLVYPVREGIPVLLVDEARQPG